MASGILLFNFSFWKRGNGRCARDTTGDFRNQSPIIPRLSTIALGASANVHSQGSKSFPRCIEALAGRGESRRGDQGAHLPGWELFCSRLVKPVARMGARRQISPMPTLNPANHNAGADGIHPSSNVLGPPGRNDAY